jgi:hypothetical protein
MIGERGAGTHACRAATRLGAPSPITPLSMQSSLHFGFAPVTEFTPAESK